MEESIEIGQDTLEGCCPLSFDIGMFCNVINVLINSPER